MNAFTTRHISSPVDLLALVPCVLGFHPEESLVLVVVAGRGGNLHARVDLPTTAEEAEAVTASLLHAADRVGARQVVLIAYSTDAAAASAAVDKLTADLEHHGIQSACALRADGQRWYSLDCDSGCCPAEGRAYDLTAHPFTAQSVLEGQVTYPDRQALARSLVGTEPEVVAEVAEAADEAVQRFRDATLRADVAGSRTDATRRHLAGEAAWVRQRVRRYLDTGEPVDAVETGRLLVAVADIDVRDLAWALMSHDNAEAHVELWRDVVRYAPEELVPPAAALLGFAAWLAGDGALAWCAVDRCREVDPDYSLAGLIAQALRLAVPPSTWCPMALEELPVFAG